MREKLDRRQEGRLTVRDESKWIKRIRREHDKINNQQTNIVTFMYCPTPNVYPRITLQSVGKTLQLISNIIPWDNLSTLLPYI